MLNARRSMAVIAFLACGALLLSGSTAAGEARRPLLKVLQLNLCNSGLAGCYTGRAVAEAATLVRANLPDVVTLNEVCQNDVRALRNQLQGAYGGSLVSAFMAAGDRPSAGVTRCRNGQPYGIGLLAHVPSPYRGYRTYGGVYDTQDTRDPEERAWLCVQAIGAFYACTTHLANTSSTVALGQCGYLMYTAIPELRKKDGYLPTVVSGDFNLRGAAQACVPPGYLRVDDGDVQQVMATTEFSVSATRLIDMQATTDHPGLLVTVYSGLNAAARRDG